MSGLLSAIGCALLGLAVGAALQRWGDREKATHAHKVDPMYAQLAARWDGW